MMTLGSLDVLAQGPGGLCSQVCIQGRGWEEDGTDLHKT